MKAPTLEASLTVVLVTLTDFEVLFSVFTLPLPLSPTATIVNEEGKVWKKVGAPNAAAVAAALGIPVILGDTL